MNVRSMLKLTLSMAIFGSIGFFTTQTGLLNKMPTSLKQVVHNKLYKMK